MWKDYWNLWGLWCENLERFPKTTNCYIKSVRGTVCFRHLHQLEYTSCYSQATWSNSHNLNTGCLGQLLCCTKSMWQFTPDETDPERTLKYNCLGKCDSQCLREKVLYYFIQNLSSIKSATGIQSKTIQYWLGSRFADLTRTVTETENTGSN